MANCVTCKANCISAGQHRVKTDCISYVPKDYPKPITNADRIRAMTDDKLAEWLSRLIFAPDCNGKCHMDFEKYGEQRTFCSDCWLVWLKQEANDVGID